MLTEPEKRKDSAFLGLPLAALLTLLSKPDREVSGRSIPAPDVLCSWRCQHVLYRGTPFEGYDLTRFFLKYPVLQVYDHRTASRAESVQLIPRRTPVLDGSEKLLEATP